MFGKWIHNFFFCKAVKAQGRLEIELHGYNIDIVEAVEEFLNYVQRFWFDRIGPQRFCVQSDPRRTNNHLESFYRKLNRLMNGANLDVWTFISNHFHYFIIFVLSLLIGLFI